MTAVLAPTPQLRAPLRPQRASPLLLSYAWYAPSLSTYDMFAARDRRVLLNARDPVVSGSPTLFNRFRRLVNEKRPIGPSARCPDADRPGGRTARAILSKFRRGGLEFTSFANPRRPMTRLFGNPHRCARHPPSTGGRFSWRDALTPRQSERWAYPLQTCQSRAVIRPGIHVRHACRLSLA